MDITNCQIVRYSVISSEELQLLVNMVNDAVVAGYVPLGGIAVEKSAVVCKYHQAMGRFKW